jgi:hypothetical protein
MNTIVEKLVSSAWCNECNKTAVYLRIKAELALDKGDDLLAAMLATGSLVASLGPTRAAEVIETEAYAGRVSPR